MNWFDHILSLQFTWRDLVDVSIVAIILYNILTLIRGTRAMQISIGLMLLGSMYFVAKAFDLAALEAISKEILFYLPFAVIVLFQHEIRRALARMGTNPLLAFFNPRTSQVNASTIADAAAILSAKRIGALIAIERTQSLRTYTEGAKMLDALVSVEMLVSIFTPGGPLHDGAVLIAGDRIRAAGAFLPLTTSVDRELAHGTRHRAALGLSEESDALMVVISEENGAIGVATEGTLRENISRSQLEDILSDRPASRTGR